MTSLFAMPYLMDIIMEYAYPPDECVAVLSELQREHAYFKLDCEFGLSNPTYEPSFAEWWFWKTQPAFDEPCDENLHFPFSWSDRDEDYKEQWWAENEDRKDLLDWPRWMDSDCFN